MLPYIVFKFICILRCREKLRVSIRVNWFILTINKINSYCWRMFLSTKQDLNREFLNLEFTNFCFCSLIILWKKKKIYFLQWKCPHLHYFLYLSRRAEEIEKLSLSTILWLHYVYYEFSYSVTVTLWHLQTHLEFWVRKQEASGKLQSLQEERQCYLIPF